jgi:hypothetical protein
MRVVSVITQLLAATSVAGSARVYRLATLLS